MSEKVENIITLDVREQLQSGREPFGLIMGTVAQLAVGQELRLIAPFEPVPLFRVLAQRGFTHASKLRDDGAWEVLFSPGESSQDKVAPPTPRPESSAADVDARGLEPPGPLVKVLEALSTIKQGGELRAHTDRRPIHLYTQLEERGFRGESAEQADGTFITLIRARADS
jgi:uncharacterized protein (DUF2249 family)